MAVPRALAGVLPDGLPRGMVVGLDRDRYLAAALLGAALAQGGCAGVVGAPELGILGIEAVCVAGADLGQLVLVDGAEHWVKAVDVLLVRTPGAVSAAVVRAVLARVRRGAARTVVLALGDTWPAPVRLRVTGARWVGLDEAGGGQLAGRQVTVVAEGSGSFAVRRKARVWLPAADGSVQPLAEQRERSGGGPRLALVGVGSAA